MTTESAWPLVDRGSVVEAPFGSNQGIPRYSVASFNQAVGQLLERGFAPRFLIDATVSRPQLKKGHLWMTLTDGEASVSAVIWASQLARLTFRPEEGDGVVVIGKLNFWAARASLTVQVLDLRPSLSSVLRQFERTLKTLPGTGGSVRAGAQTPPARGPWHHRPAHQRAQFRPGRHAAHRSRTLAHHPRVRGPHPGAGGSRRPKSAPLLRPGRRAEALGVEAIVLARGSSNREDLVVFDGESLARLLAHCPVPVVTGLGHEDDTTIADLVADYRAATPTAAIVALLSDRPAALQRLKEARRQLQSLLQLRLQGARLRLQDRRDRLKTLQPLELIGSRRRELAHRRALLEALSPQKLLSKGFCLIRDPSGQLVRSTSQLSTDQEVLIQLADGSADARITAVQPIPPPLTVRPRTRRSRSHP